MADLPLASDQGAQEVEIVQSATQNRMAISANGALPPRSDVTNTGTITALNGAVTVATNGCSTVVFNVTGTWVATVSVQATSDGVNWFSTLYNTPGTGDIEFISVTNPNTLVVNCGGYLQVRLIATAFTSGTVAIAYNAGAGVNSLEVVSLNAASFATTATLKAVNLGVTVTAATGVAATATLPAVAANFHYIPHIEITAYTTAARTGVATPILVTTTNMQGSPVWDFATVAAIGTTDRLVQDFNLPLQSSVSNTATTIVCPATTGIIWRVNVFYYTGP